MTLEDLRILVAACETGSMSSLARELQRTQSSVSQHIARLEAELGVRLLERHARGVQPTAAGKILKDFAMEGLDAIEIGLQRIRALQHGESDTLTITTGGTTVRHFMSTAVVRFRKEHPGVNLRFLPANSTRRCFEILRLSQADLGFVTTGSTMDASMDTAPRLLGLFPVNVVHNIVHALFGVWGLAASRSFSGAKTYAQISGPLYLVIALLGLVAPNGFGLMPMGGNDIWLHALIGAVLTWAGFTARHTTTAHTGHAV